MRKLLAEWAALVSQVENGYTFCSAEYDNDLYVRVQLASEISALPPERREAWALTLQPFDDRFLLATRPRIRPMFEMELLNRIPIKLIGDLELDVKNLEL